MIAREVGLIHRLIMPALCKNDKRLGKGPETSHLSHPSTVLTVRTVRLYNCTSTTRAGEQVRLESSLVNRDR